MSITDALSRFVDHQLRGLRPSGKKQSHFDVQVCRVREVCGSQDRVTFVDVLSFRPAREVKFGMMRLINECYGPLVCNLSSVDELDASGLEALCSMFVKTRAAGIPLSVICPSPKVRQLLKVTGLADLIDVYATEAAALDAMSFRILGTTPDAKAA